MAGPAFDAASNPTPATGDLSWTHTPVGTPRGAAVIVVQNGADADRVVGSAYGALALTEPTGSPVTATAGDEDAVVSLFWAGASIPTGAQTVTVDVDDVGTTKAAVCVTVTAAADVELEDVGSVVSASLQNPSFTLDTTASLETFIFAALFVALAVPTNVTPGGDFTQLLEHDFGNQVANFVRRTSNGAGGSITVDWTTGAADDVAAIGIALKEAAAAASDLVITPVLVGTAVHRASRW